MLKFVQRFPLRLEASFLPRMPFTIKQPIKSKTYQVSAIYGMIFFLFWCLLNFFPFWAWLMLWFSFKPFWLHAQSAYVRCISKSICPCLTTIKLHHSFVVQRVFCFFRVNLKFELFCLIHCICVSGRSSPPMDLYTQPDFNMSGFQPASTQLPSQFKPQSTSAQRFTGAPATQHGPTTQRVTGSEHGTSSIQVSSQLPTQFNPPSTSTQASQISAKFKPQSTSTQVGELYHLSV